MMFECRNCGCKFIDPVIVYESHGLDHPPYEEIEVCPMCKLPDFSSYDEDREEDDDGD